MFCFYADSDGQCATLATCKIITEPRAIYGYYCPEHGELMLAVVDELERQSSAPIVQIADRIEQRQRELAQ